MLKMHKNNQFHLIRDEAKLDIPIYIDEPDYVRYKIAGYGLMAFGWMVWMWLFSPILTVVFWGIEGQVAYEQIVLHRNERIDLSLVTLVFLIVIFILFLYAWASYNWIRFRGKEKRQSPQPVERGALAQSFDIQPTDIDALQFSQNIILYYNKDGVLVEYELTDLLKKQHLAT